MRRWEIREVGLPTAAGGKELEGTHPAIIVQDEKKFGVLHPFTIVVPLTSNLERAKLPFCVQIAKEGTTGLREDSVALVPQLRTVDRQRIRGTRGYLSRDDITKIEQALRAVLGL